MQSRPQTRQRLSAPQPAHHQQRQHPCQRWRLRRQCPLRRGSRWQCSHGQLIHSPSLSSSHLLKPVWAWWAMPGKAVAATAAARTEEACATKAQEACLLGVPGLVAPSETAKVESPSLRRCRQAWGSRCGEAPAHHLPVAYHHPSSSCHTCTHAHAHAHKHMSDSFPALDWLLVANTHAHRHNIVKMP